MWDLSPSRLDFMEELSFADVLGSCETFGKVLASAANRVEHWNKDHVVHAFGWADYIQQARCCVQHSVRLTVYDTHVCALQMPALAGRSCYRLCQDRMMSSNSMRLSQRCSTALRRKTPRGIPSSHAIAWCSQLTLCRARAQSSHACSCRIVAHPK